MLKIMLVDDQRLMCDGLKSMLETDENFTVVAMAYNGMEAVELAKKYEPNLVLLDIRMPIMNGVEAVLKIKQQNEAIKIIMLTTFNDENYVMDAIANGADGYLLKDVEMDELIEAIHKTLSGSMVMPSEVANKLKKGLSDVKKGKETEKILKTKGFTNREIDISKMLVEGFNNSQIASALYLSQGTVRNYISTIYEKLEKTDRTNAVLELKKIGL